MPSQRLGERIFLVFFLSIISVLTGIDIMEDLAEGRNLRHLGLDLSVAIISLATIIALALRLKRDKEKFTQLQTEKLHLQEILKQNQKDQSEKNTEHLVRGLSHLIDEEFEKWRLTVAERDVAMLMLKGMNTGDIAQLRQRSEKTVRHQTSSIYRKAGIKNRQELQAFFLEDLM